MDHATKSRSLNLSTLILISLVGSIIFGVVLKLYLPDLAPKIDQYLLSPLGKAFLRLIQFVVVPIIFSSLILGLIRIPAQQAGRYLGRLFFCYAVTNAIGVLLGLGLALWLQPGSGINGVLIADLPVTHQSQSIVDWLINLIPINPLEALSTSNLLQTIFSAALLVIGIQLAGEKSKPFIQGLESINAISLKLLSVILYTSPIGVFALTSSVIASRGLQLVSNLLLYVVGLWVGSLIMIGLYSLALWLIQGKLLYFFQCFSPALSVAFGTASSISTLPLILENARFYGMSEDIIAFAIPVGAAIKRDGAAILQSFNAIFIAQLFHVPITSELIVTIAISSFLVSFSTPGVPGSSLIIMTPVLTAAGLPLEGIAIVAGVDRLIDGIKATLNIIGNISNALFLAKWEQLASPLMNKQA